MNTLRVSEIEIHRQVFSKLLLELNVCRVDPRVSIVLAKHANRCKGRKATQRRHVHDVGPYRQGLTVATAEGRSARNTELLHAVVSDRTNLRQHVLASVKDARMRPQHRLALIR